MANNPNLISEDQIPANWQPVDAHSAAPAAPAPVQPDIPQYFSGSMPPALQHDASFVATEIGTPRIPKSPLMPLGLQASPQTNAAVSSTSKIIIQNTPAPPAAAGGVTSVGLSMPPEFTVTGSPITGAGTLGASWATENSATVLQVPPPGLGSLQAVIATGGSTNPISISGNAKSTPATAFFFSNSLGSPQNFTGLTNIAGTNIYYKTAAPFSGTASAAGSWAAQMLIFGGVVTPVQGANTTSGFSSLAFGSNNTAGNTILVFMTLYNFTSQPGINPALSDSQNNRYQQVLAQVINPSSVDQYWTYVYVATNIAGGANTVSFSFNDPLGHSGKISIAEVGPLAAGAGTPLFAPIFVGEIPPISLTTTGNGGVTGILPIASGGTGTRNSATGTAGGVVLSNSPTIVTPTISGNETLNGKLSTYNSIATVANGVPSELAQVNSIGLTAAIATTMLYAVLASGAGQYRLSWNAKVTTAATTSSTLGALTITYTDPDGVVQTITCAAQNAAGVIETSDAGNTTTTVLLGHPLLLNVKNSTNIQYAMAYASVGATAMQYNLHIVLEAM